MRNLLKFLSGSMLLFLLSSAVHAQDPNTELMKKLYTKIGENVSVGSNDPTTGESYLVLANPGILIDPTLNYNTPAGRNQFARSVDKVLNPEWIYGTRNYSVFDIYNDILNYHEAADIKPTARQIQQYKDAAKVIYSDWNDPQPGVPSPAYARYQKALKDLVTISKQAEDYKRINQTEELPPDLLSELTQDTDNLELIGNRVQIEAAKANINTYEHIDPNAWWGEKLGQFQKNSETYNTNRFGKLDLYPSYPVWLDMSRTWEKVSLSQSELEQTTTNSHTSIGGNGGFNLGFWSVGVDYSNTQNRSHYELTGSDYLLSMELMRVTVDRPWMDEGVFESHAWRWLQGNTYYGRKIASGADATSGVAPPSTDIMPFIPTGLLLARRVSITANWSHDLKNSFDSHTSGGASVGWGPFSFGGRYDTSDSQSYMKANAAGNTISWDAPQIIGFFVQVLPESPKPDPRYRFPSDSAEPQALVPSDPAELHALDINRRRMMSFRNWRPKVVLDSDMAIDQAKSILRDSYSAKSVRLKFDAEKRLNH